MVIKDYLDMMIYEGIREVKFLFVDEDKYNMKYIHKKRKGSFMLVKNPKDSPKFKRFKKAQRKALEKEKNNMMIYG